MKVTHVLVVALLFVAGCLHAQTAGDFRSFQSGTWDDVNTWERFNGAIWVNPAPSTPTNADGIITIIDTHTVNVDASVTADQIEWDNSCPFCASSGSLIVDAGVTLTIANGGGDDVRIINDFSNVGTLTVDGTLRVNNGATIVEDDYGNLGGIVTPATAGTYHVTSTGTHIHTTGAGVGALPSADFQSGSTCRIEAAGIPAPAIDNTTAFHHFVWDGTAQSASMNLGGNVQNVAGDMTVTGTNGNILQLSTITAYTLNVTGNLSFTGNSRVTLTATGNPVVINVTGNFDISSTNTSVSPPAIQFNAASPSVDINVTGDFSKSGASLLTMIAGTSVGTSTTLDITGNFSFTGGSITKNGSANPTARISFLGSNTRTFTNSGGAFFNQINFLIGSGKTLNMGTSIMSGGGSFTNNGTVGLGSLDVNGALQLAAVGGNIQVTGTRTFANPSTVVYNGSSIQYIGNGNPSTTGTTTRISNSNNVEIPGAGNTASVATLDLASGNLVVGQNTLSFSSYTTTGGSIQITNQSSITVTGTGVLATALAFNGNTLANFTLNRTGGGLVTLGSDLDIDGTFTQTAGTLDFTGSGRTLTISGDYVLTAGSLTFGSTSVLIIDGSGALPAAFALGSTTIGTLEMERATIATLGTLTVNSQLNLLDGTIAGSGTLTVGSGGTVTRSDGAITKTVAATSYHLIYSNTGTISTGTEVVTSPSTALQNLTSTASGGVNLSTPLTVNGILTLTGSGVFNSNSNAVTFLGNVVSNGANSFVTSTTTFGGTTTISGTETLGLGSVVLSNGASLNLGTATFIDIDGNFDADNGGTMIAGTSTTTFSGTTTITIGATGNSNASTTNAPKFHHVVVGSGNTLNITCSTCGVSNDRPSIEISGDWNSAASGAVFDPSPNPGGGVVTEARFVGGTQAINSLASHPFWDLTTAGTGTLTLTGPLVIENDFVISGTKSIDTNVANDYPLSIGDDFILDGGALTLNESTVTLNGSGNQNIDRISGSGTTSFYNIVINKAAGSFIVSTDIDVRHEVTISSNTAVDFDGSTDTDVLTLISDQNGTAVIGPIVSPADPTLVTGRITQQRYMEPATRYRYISTPVQNPQVVDLQGEIPVTGSFTGTSFPPQTGCTGCTPCTGCATNNQSMFIYQESLPGAVTQRYLDFPSAINTETMTAGRAYSVFVRNGSTPTTWNLRGVPNKGDISIPATNSNDGWNLVGNPYPARLDWGLADGAALWTRTNIDPTIYIWSLEDNNYATYNRITTSSTFGGSQYIAVGQAFWVHASGAPTLTAREGVKTAQLATFFREGAEDDVLRITLAQDDSHRDQALIHFNIEGSTDAYDQGIDSHEFPSDSLLSIHSISSDKKRLAINSVEARSDCFKAIELGLAGVKPGILSLNFAEMESFTTPVSIYLLDRYTNTAVDIAASSTYEFVVNADSASYEYSRFQLYFTDQLIELDKEVTGSTACVESTSSVSIKESQKGISYYALVDGKRVSEAIDGTGEEIFLDISSSVFTIAGAHQVNLVAAVPGCINLPMTKSATIEVTSMDSVKISSEGTNLVSSHPAGNQWYFNDNLIEGATEQYLTPTEDGEYSVVVQAGLCSGSATTSYLVTAVETEGNGVFTVYPNPTDGLIKVVVHSSQENVEVRLYSIIGSLIGEASSSAQSGERVTTFDLSDKAGGVYLITVQDGTKTYRRRIVRK